MIEPLNNTYDRIKKLAKDSEEWRGKMSRRIEGERIYLRPMAAEDLDAVHSYASLAVVSERLLSWVFFRRHGV
jgi:hypothetical protein